MPRIRARAHPRNSESYGFYIHGVVLSTWIYKFMQLILCMYQDLNFNCSIRQIETNIARFKLSIRHCFLLKKDLGNNPLFGKYSFRSLKTLRKKYI